MKFTRILFFIFMLIFFNISCRNTNKSGSQGSEQSTPSDELGKTVFKKDANTNNEINQKFIGYWQGVKSDVWLEFRADGTYLIGKGNKSSKKTMKYKINGKDSVITVQTRKRIKEFPFSFSGDVLIIHQDKGEFRYVKLEKRPAY